MEIEDAVLVARAKANPEAFGALYDRYVDEVYGFVCARLHNVAAAEDVTAEVFLNALRAMPRYREEGRPFRCWLFRIATNAVASYFRRLPVQAEVSDQLPDPALPVEMTVLRNLEVASLWKLVAQLPPQQQQAMRLRFQEDLSAREAARIMRKSDAAVKLLIYRAVGRLRLQMAGPPGGVPVPSVPSAI